MISGIISAMDEYREKIRSLLVGHVPPIDMKAASKAMGKSHAYMQQFLDGRSPEYLAYEDAIALANFIGVEEKEVLHPKQLKKLGRTDAAQQNQERSGAPGKGGLTPPAFVTPLLPHGQTLPEGKELVITIRLQDVR